jgi:hypothetical protein
MGSNRLLSYLHPYRRRSSFPNIGERGNHVVKMADEATVNESRHRWLERGMKEG